MSSQQDAVLISFFFSSICIKANSSSWLITAPLWTVSTSGQQRAFEAPETQNADSRTDTGPSCAAAELYLRRYWSELVVAVQVELSAVGVAAEVQRLIPVDGKAENAQEEHPH